MCTVDSADFRVEAPWTVPPLKASTERSRAARSAGPCPTSHKRKAWSTVCHNTQTLAALLRDIVARTAIEQPPTTSRATTLRHEPRVRIGARIPRSNSPQTITLFLFIFSSVCEYVFAARCDFRRCSKHTPGGLAFRTTFCEMNPLIGIFCLFRALSSQRLPEIASRGP
jgi:hypothetical protein